MVKKSAKGTQSRADTITVRLHPKVKYGLDLIARKQRRTLSSVVEWAICNAFDHPDSGLHGEFENPATGEKSDFILDLLWDADDGMRFIKLAQGSSDWLTYEEELMWDFIKGNARYWVMYEDDVVRNLYHWDTRDPGNLMVKKVLEDWEKLKQYARGELSKYEVLKDGWFDRVSGGVYCTVFSTNKR